MQAMVAETSKANASRRGNAYVEFALVFLLLLTLLVGAFEFIWVLFVHATFHHATREAVRAAITANPPAGFSSAFDDYLKDVIKTQTFGLLSDEDLDAHVQVQYFDPACEDPDCEISDAEASSIVQVSIRCYEVGAISSLIRPRDPGTGQIVPFTINVSSSDRLEPFPGEPPDRGALAIPTALNPSTGACN
jgi:hypothetical protein